MDKRDYYRAVLLGIVIGIAFITAFSVFTQEDEPEASPKSNFEVVDTYEGCDVVRWHYSMLAEYKYFLVCEK
jgi:hypothetical protein